MIQQKADKQFLASYPAMGLEREQKRAAVIELETLLTVGQNGYEEI